MRSLDVLVVGAGPTGLTLACDLARRGVSCEVVDASAAPFVGSRAKGLQPRTLEVFDDLGVLDAIVARGMPFPPFRMYVGEELAWERPLEQMLRLAPAVPSPSVPYPRAWLIPQWRTNRILHERLVDSGGQVAFGVELVELRQRDDGVEATLRRDGAIERVLARYLVGADGGGSFVRKACGFSFEGTTHDAERTLIADVRASGLRGPACHIFTRSGAMADRISLWDLPHSEYFQLVATMPANEAPELTLAGVREVFAERSGRTDVVLEDVRWVSLYRANVRMVDRMRDGRVLLAGDAAHVHSPAGGQGLNTGVQDAYNLGWKLAAAIASDRSLPLLDSYEEERLPVAARVLDLTSRLDARGFRVDPAGPPPSLDQLDISYRGGSLAFDDGTVSSALRAGDRAPDARLPDGSRLFDRLRGSHFTCLAFGRPEPRGLPGVRGVRCAEALPGYEVTSGYVLVRPDGHVAALSSSADAVRSYLDHLGVLV